MIRIALCFVALCAASALAHPAAAQHTLTLSLTDSLTGEPVRRSYAWVATQRSVTGMPDGTIRIDRLPAGRHEVSLHCHTSSSFQPADLGTRTLDVPADGDVIHVRVDASACDQRLVREARLRLHGYLEGGFEHSRFVPCRTERLPEGFEEISDDDVWVWVESSGAGPADVRIPWPDPQRRSGYSRWHVEVVGTLRGPDRYGHLGGAEYELTIEHVPVVDTPETGDCHA